MLLRRYLPTALWLGLLCWSTFAQGPVSKVHGVDFSPYLNGQNPSTGPQIGIGQITSRLQIVAPYVKWVRSFASTNGLEKIPSIARQFGLKVAANAWISSDLAHNTLEINNLIANANAGLVDIAIVGSEAILRNDVSESQLIAYMNQVRQAIPSSVLVTTADVWGTFIARPNLIAASDVVFVNLYPYWEQTAVDNAVCSLAQEYQQVVYAAGSKPVVVSETGWPSAGNAVGAAVPSVANANQYALQFFTWAAANSIPAFYFEAFDETWKANIEAPQGAHWGIWDTTGSIKPGMDAFFNGQTAPVSCNGPIPGPVAVRFSYVPPYGSAEDLEVQVTGVRPADYVLAAYIKVSGGWWTKPTFAQSTVGLNVDGSARVRIVTGGSDQLATDIAVFLIPAGTLPPPANGGSLPTPPGAVASGQVNRTQSSISGIVTDAQNHPVAGAIVSDPVLGQTASAPDGKYSFYQIATAGTATLTAAYPNLGFGAPRTVNIPNASLIVNFAGAPPPVVTPVILPGALTGFPYRAILTSTGGTPPYTGWTVISGILPLGLALDSASGIISGIPATHGGPFIFDVSVMDSLGSVSEGQSFSITVTIRSDFDGNGVPDLIWQDPVSGLAQIWYLGGAQGTTTIGAANLTASNTWRIVGVGDFNRDGNPDVVWQDPVTGAAQVWFLGGTQGNVVTGAATLSTGNSWRIMSIADFNGDGQPDCIWQDPASGQAQIWFMGGAQGTTLTGAANLTASNSWRIAGTGDFNRDGRPDVIWQDPVSGATQIWFLGGAQGNVVTNAVNLTGANPWRIAAVSDFNGDSHPDVAWQDPVSGTSQVWLLGGAQGTTITGTAPLSGANAWRIAGPR